MPRAKDREETPPDACARTEKGPRARRPSASLCPRCRGPRHERPSLRATSQGGWNREVGWAEAHGLKLSVHAALRVVRCPAGRILKEPNRPDTTVGAEIEPVMRATRYTNQVAGLNFDRKHRSLGRMDVKEPAPFDDEPHLIFVVPVLTAEL